MKMRFIGYTAILFCISLFIGMKAQANDITGAAFGEVYNYNSLNGYDVKDQSGPSSGDTFYNGWGANDTFYMMHDDGRGFNNGTYVNNRLTKVDGNPNTSTAGVQGTNLDPGTLSNNMPQTYSAGMYEVNNVLYQFKHYSCQSSCGYDGLTFYNTSMIKSTDGGANWYNHLGQLNTAPPNNLAQSTFTDNRWGFPTFINYGKGGVAPNIDNAATYAYITSHDNSATGEDNPLNGLFGDKVYLARIPLSSLANLNKNDIEYYKSGDGMVNANWSSNIADSGPILTDNSNQHAPQINYDSALQRYVMSSNSSFFGNNSTANQKYRLEIYTAPHPWGPWTKLLSYGEPYILAGVLANNKWTSADGKKMWWLSTGGYNGDYYPYGLLFHSVYLSEGVVDTYEAESATLTGTSTATSYPSYSGTGYVGSLDAAGDSVKFTVNNINGTGWHIVKLRYASTNTSGNPISIFVNNKKVKTINKLSWNDNSYKTSHNWTEHSAIYYLDNGTNTFEIKQDTGDNGTGLMIDSIYVSREKTYDEGQNIALNATASASTVYSGTTAGAVNDGVSSGSPLNFSNEWASTENTGAWVQLNWSSNATINKIVLYDRPNTSNKVTSGTLSFSDNTTISVGNLQNDGKAGTVITFPDKTVTWVKFTINTALGSNSGISELEAYGSGGGMPTAPPGWTNLALNKTVTVSTEHAQYPKAGATDGNLGTIWAGNSASFPQWIYVDLGASKAIGSTKWTSGNTDNSTSKYKIEGSNDASSWTLLADRTTTGVTTNGYMTDNVTGSYRYVRLTITNINNAHWASVGELEVYAPNLALSKPVTVSTEHTSYLKPNAVDGNLNTIWAGNSASFPQWIYVDLGAAKALGSIRWTSGNTDNSTSKYKIEGSTDLSSWTTLADKTVTGVTTNDYMPESVSGTYRYVRLTITNINNAHWASVGELEVYAP